MQKTAPKLTSFPRDTHWRTEHFQQPPFQDLLLLHDFSQEPAWLSAERLSEVMSHADIGFQQQSVTGSNTDGVEALAEPIDTRYYEEIIFQDKLVPTRFANWHDFFNACIWGLFPKTKAQLNQIHMHEIREFGLKPRTARRDRVTHFDECGVVLAYSCASIATGLRDHAWLDIWGQGRANWLSESRQVRAYIFGHANYEMLMQPHIGLTGKWLGVSVAESFWQQPLAAQYRHLDAALLDICSADDSFTQRQMLAPLPLLGVPTWCDLNNDPEFYNNTQYFRPKRSSR